MKLAAIDIGSNAIRLIIIRVLDHERGIIKRQEFIRIPLRLGDDVFRDGAISGNKIATLCKAMEAFRIIMDIHQVHDFRACATSAMREASNGQEVIDRVEQHSGIRIEIISGMLESKIILESVFNLFPNRGNFLNIDVGGGSTEMTLIEKHQVVKSVSFDVGTVRMLYAYPPESVWTSMQQWVEENVLPIKPVIAVGTGGNINKAFRMLGLSDRDGLNMEKLKSLYSQIKSLSVRDRMIEFRLNADRADVIEPALKIHLSILRWGDIKKIYAPNAGLKDGIIRELMEKNLGIPVEQALQ